MTTNPDCSLRAADRRVVGLMAAFFVAIVALLGLSEMPPAPNATQLASRSDAAPRLPGASDRTSLGPAAAAVEARWAADESAQGMRSESAH